MHEAVLRPYQHQIVEFILNNPRCAIWASMGLGKSLATLTALDLLTFVESGPALVLAPLRVAASTWPDEAAKWPHLADLRVVAVVGSAGERRRALTTPADVYTTNYENIPWLVEHFGDAWPFSIVIADESTKLKSFRLRQGGKRAQALAKVAHSKVKHFVELTGTPAPNGLIDLWAPAWFLDKGARLGRSFGAFESRWFRAISVGQDAFARRLEPMPHAQAEIEAALSDVCLALDARDHFDIADPIVNTIKVEMPEAARTFYKAMEREMFIELAGGAEVEAFNAAARTMKCLQLANGAIYTDESATVWEEVHDAKLQALAEIVEEAAGMPVLVAYHFRSDLARLQKAFPQGRALDKSPQTIREWNAGRIPVMFVHPASAGHGLNLQDGGNILAFFGLNWNLEERLQVIERIGPTRQAQAGHKRPVFIHNIVAAGTVDELVLKRVETKREVQDLLLEAMKEKNDDASQD